MAPAHPPIRVSRVSRVSQGEHSLLLLSCTHPRELLIATLPRTLYRLPVLHRRSGVVYVYMPLQTGLAPALSATTGDNTPTLLVQKSGWSEGGQHFWHGGASQVRVHLASVFGFKHPVTAQLATATGESRRCATPACTAGALRRHVKRETRRMAESWCHHIWLGGRGGRHICQTDAASQPHPVATPLRGRDGHRPVLDTARSQRGQRLHPRKSDFLDQMPGLSSCSTNIDAASGVPQFSTVISDGFTAAQPSSESPLTSSSS